MRWIEKERMRSLITKENEKKGRKENEEEREREWAGGGCV
jgi:hypothetical protein